MSLVGNLEDLGLGEILQILSLSGKSGVLRLKSKTGEGQLLFHRGLIRSAQLRQGPEDLLQLIERAGLVEPAEFESMRERRHGGASAEEAALGSDKLEPEALDTLRREHIENSVLAMFTWRSGEFSFVIEAGATERFQDGGLLLSPGLNAQFLALEGTRIHDESAGGEAGSVPDGFDAASEGAVGENAEADGSEASAAPAAPVESEPEVLAEAVLVDADASDPAETVLDAVPVSAAPAEAESRVAVPIVAVDPELALLEWIKGALGGLETRVHVFQRSEQAIHRIRQYVMRAERPLVLLTTETPADPVSGAANWAEICARLRAQVPQLRLVLLEDPDAAKRKPPQGAEPTARSEKPSPTTLFDPRAAERRAALGEALCDVVRSATTADAKRS